MSTDTDTDSAAVPRPSERGGRAVRAVIWLPGLAVALGAAVATAHGLYEVAAAARVPAGIAWLYPLITDGLALVAYAATARLHGSAARYAWSVVVLAAGLSGLAQAAFLASGSAVDASAALRFGVGAWPAIAAAIVAHLLYLLATDTAAAAVTELGDSTWRQRSAAPVQPEPSRPTAIVQSPRTTVQPDLPSAGAAGVQPPGGVAAIEHPTPPPASRAEPPAEHRAVRPVESTARDRARAAAERHAARHGALPTVTELETAADVSRGTAGAVLKALRDRPTSLHLITGSEQHEHDDDPTIEEHTQP